MKPIRAVAVLPTLFTLGNLLCGFFAIVVASRIAKPGPEDLIAQPAEPIALKAAAVKEFLVSDDPTHNLMLCGALILLAMLLDAFDGQVARLTRHISSFGAELDSLADLVSFGIAPAILLVKMCPQFTILHGKEIWSIAALFVCCAALRLARFNVETDEDDDHTTFAGLPTPAAAAVVASFGIFSYTLRNEFNYEHYAGYDWWMQRLLPMFCVLIALLMVSRVPYPHPLSQLIRGQSSFAHLVAIVFAVVAVLEVRGFAVPLICLLFVLGPPLRFGWQVARHRRTSEEPLF